MPAPRIAYQQDATRRGCAGEGSTPDRLFAHTLRPLEDAARSLAFVKGLLAR